MKISISKNKDGNGYYTKLKNSYNGVESEYIMSLQLPKGVDIEWGTYNIDGFMSCYKGKNGEARPKLVITSIEEKRDTKTSYTRDELTEDVDFGTTVELGDEDLAF